MLARMTYGVAEEALQPDSGACMLEIQVYWQRNDGNDWLDMTE